MFYVSLTSIYQNQSRLYQTLNDVVHTQTLLPEKIFIQLSEEPYLRDIGFKNKQITDINLLQLLEKYNNLIELRWVKNIGPYRKLIYTISDNWESEIPIITIDDDHLFDNNLFKNLYNDYLENNMCANYRGFTMASENLKQFDYEAKASLKQRYLYNFSTNGGGTIFNSKFFKNTNNLLLDDTVFLQLANTADDIWYNFIRIINDSLLFVSHDKKWMKRDNSNHANGLYFNYNKKSNNIIAKKIIDYLLEFKYYKDV